jgi:hypothetical protein
MTPEFTMLCTPAPSAPVARGAFETSFSSESEVDRACDDHEVVGSSTPADPRRQRTVRRRFVDPTATDANRAAAEQEFIRAMHEYKQRSCRMFPTWSEVLEVLQDLGYEKAACQATGGGIRSAARAAG